MDDAGRIEGTIVRLQGASGKCMLLVCWALLIDGNACSAGLRVEVIRRQANIGSKQFALGQCFKSKVSTRFNF